MTDGQMAVALLPERLGKTKILKGDRLKEYLTLCQFLSNYSVSVVSSRKKSENPTNFDVGKGSPVIHKLTGGELPNNK
ncbi:hypothetical protein [Okeania sp. KiyG1]|uniref:hypothetical protein n=1 Tax=Okeania sp. KiyG1 TaxID=2720165 RepID=UPI001921D5E3|nr:hypothetical protein [Okeania sp. KiyG1]